MACYVIVTCLSMLWTLLTVITTLVTLYCLTSTQWLIGHSRPYERYRVSMANATDRQQQYTFVKTDDTRTDVPTYHPSIGLYSRCVRVPSSGESTMSCASFASSLGESNDIFPIAWQVSLVLAGVASLLLLFVMLSAIFSLCVRDFCRKSIFTISGLIQVISGLLLSVAIALYPIGWSSAKLQYYCGKESTAYHKSECTIGWAFMAIIVCTFVLFATGMLSIKADRSTSKDEIEDEILEGKHLICIK